jgi:hypothetical protein
MIRRPYMKNHTAVGDIKNMAQLFVAFKKRKSIYFRPLNRVMPVKFFIGWSWGLENLQRHIDMGSFYDVMLKMERVRSRIRSQLANCPVIVRVDKERGRFVIPRRSWDKLVN